MTTGCAISLVNQTISIVIPAKIIAKARIQLVWYLCGKSLGNEKTFNMFGRAFPSLFLIFQTGIELEKVLRNENTF